MKLTISTIKVLFWISIALLIISLLFAIIFQFCDNNGIVSWIISISTGVFASSFVLLLAEYIRYIHQRRDVEYSFFHHLSSIYSNLLSIKNDIGIRMVATDKSVQSSFIRPQLEEIRKNTDTLFEIEYYTLCMSGEMIRAIYTFKIDNIPALQQFYLFACSLDISINEDKILIYKQKMDLLKKHQNDVDIQDIVTIESPKTSITMAKIKDNIENELLSMVDSMLIKMEHMYPKRYRWSQLKLVIENNVFQVNR